MSDNLSASMTLIHYHSDITLSIPKHHFFLKFFSVDVKLSGIGTFKRLRFSKMLKLSFKIKNKDTKGNNGVNPSIWSMSISLQRTTQRIIPTFVKIPFRPPVEFSFFS